VFDEIPHSEKVLKRHQNSDDPFIMAWDHYKQYGFLEGHQIHEATGVTRKGLHSLKTTKSKGTIIKKDLSKAFDRVN
jgi:hypothetical protein